MTSNLDASFFQQLIDRIDGEVCVSDARTGRMILANGRMKRFPFSTENQSGGETSFRKEKKNSFVSAEKGSYFRRERNPEDGKDYLCCGLTGTYNGRDYCLWCRFEAAAGEYSPVPTLYFLPDKKEKHPFLDELQLLRFVSRNLPLGILAVYDSEEFPLMCLSQTILDSTGYTYDEIYGEKDGYYARLIHPDDRGRVSEEVHRQLEMHSLYSVEYRVVKKDGSFFWVRDRGCYVDNGEEDRVLLCFTVNITEESKERMELETILKNSSGGAYKAVLCEGFPVLYANDGYYALHGYTRQQFKEEVKNMAASLVLPEDAKRVSEEIEACRKSKKDKIVMEYRVRRRDGAVAWLRSDISFVEDEDGGTLLMGTVLDVTERKELTLRLQRISALYKIAQKNSRLNMWELDLQNHRIIQTEESKALHGYGDVIENVPESLFEDGYFHPDTERTVRELFERVYRGEDHVSAVYKAKKKDADGYWWEKVTYERVPNKSGEVLYAVGISEDVTEQKETELRQSMSSALNQMLNEDVLFSVRFDLNSESVVNSWFSEQALPPEKDEKDSYSGIFRYILRTMANSDDAMRFRDRFMSGQMKEFMQSGREIPTFECRQKTADGRIFWVRFTLRIMIDSKNDRRLLTLYARDITSLRLRELKLRQKAERDEETGLYNLDTAKLLIQDILKSGMRGRSGAMALLEIDGFSGDEKRQERKKLLSGIGAQILSGLPLTCISARASENTLMIFSSSVSAAEDQFTVLKRLMEGITHSKESLFGGSLRIFTGITCRIGPGMDFEQIMGNAAQLLGQARKNGSSQIVSDLEEKISPSKEQFVRGIKEFSEQSWKTFEQGASPDEIAKSIFAALGRDVGMKRITLLLRLPGGRLQKQMEWRSSTETEPLAVQNSDMLYRLFWSVPPDCQSLVVREESDEIFDDLRSSVGEPMLPAVLCSARENGTPALCILAEGAQSIPDVEGMKLLAAFLRRIYFINELRTQYESAALHDSVTELFNFEGYLQRLRRIHEDALSSFGMASAYILNFKQYNQQYGTNGGNMLLRQAAGVLEDVFGSDNCYRVSGATFQILCPDVTHEHFSQRCRLMEEKMNRLCPGRIACAGAWEENAISLRALEEQVEERLEVAANCLRMKNRESAKQSAYTVLQDVREKIKNGNFVIFLQPKALAATEEICGAEALIRYRDEKKGILPPAEFLNVIEKAGAIREIDLFVLEQVCRTMRQWLDEGWKGYPVSLNFSRATILEPDILTETNRIVESCGVPKELIEIEITETISSTDSMGLQEIVHQLAQAGYRIAIDDFGADYSNLYVLYLLDIHTLKLDRKIINDVYCNERAREVVNDLIGLCRRMKISSVAEGVQTKEQLETLRQMSCDMIQGYYLNKPISAEDFKRLYIRTDGGALSNG